MLRARAKYLLFDTALCVLRLNMSAQFPSVGEAFNPDPQACCLDVHNIHAYAYYIRYFMYVIIYTLDHKIW